TEFVRELRDYLKTSKPEFINAIQTEKVMSESSEAILKDAIKQVVSGLLVAA
ncbi:MAG: F0F1 ATP synthase subunit alpha, partial [Prochlorococcaceae cyanobacterium]